MVVAVAAHVVARGNGAPGEASSSSGRTLAAHESNVAGRGDHRGVVGATRRRRHVDAKAIFIACAHHRRAQRRVRRDAAADLHVLEPEPASGTPRLAHEHLDDRGLIARTQIGERLRFGHPVRAHVMQQRGLEPAEREVVAVLARGHRARERDRVRISRARESIDHDAARITKAEQLGALVERLARGVVARRAELDDLAAIDHAHQRCMAARNDQREVRHRRLLGLEKDRRQMALEVMHADERHPGDPRDRLRRLQPDEQRADEPGRIRHRDAVDFGERASGAFERGLHDGHDVQDVRARCELRHDAAVTLVDLVLRRDHIRAHDASIVDDRRGGLVARALEPEHAKRHGGCSSI